MANPLSAPLGTRLAGLAFLLALLAGCGDGGSVVTAPTPAPPTPAAPTPAPATLVTQGQQALEAPKAVGGTRVANWDFTTPVAGTLEVTISYLRGDSRVLVWVTDRPCSSPQFERDDCFYLAKSLEGANPRRLTAAGVPAGPYSLFVANDGPNDEQIGYRVTVTPGASGGGR